jgi:DNA-binding transcriptional LysR family regulator
VDFVFVAAPGHPLAALPEPLAPAVLQRHRAIAIADTSRELLARSSGLISGQDVLTVPDTAAKLAALGLGLGVGHLPRHQAAAALAAGTLVAKEVAEPKPTLPLYLAWRSVHEGNALAWFLERLADDGLRRRLLGHAPRGEPRRTAGTRLRRG